MDNYLEQLIERGKKAHVKRGYFVYHIDTGKWLGRVKSYRDYWFLSDEPLQTFRSIAFRKSCTQRQTFGVIVFRIMIGFWLKSRRIYAYYSW